MNSFESREITIVYDHCGEVRLLVVVVRAGIELFEILKVEIDQPIHAVIGHIDGFELLVAGGNTGELECFETSIVEEKDFVVVIVVYLGLDGGYVLLEEAELMGLGVVMGE